MIHGHRANAFFIIIFHVSLPFHSPSILGVFHSLLYPLSSFFPLSIPPLLYPLSSFFPLSILLLSSLYIHTYVCTYVCTCMYVRMYIHTCTYVPYYIII